MSFGETESSMLCPPRKSRHLLPKSVFDRPGSDRWNLASTTFLTRDRWFESTSLQQRVSCEPRLGVSGGWTADLGCHTRATPLRPGRASRTTAEVGAKAWCGASTLSL